ncbi:T20D4.11-like domain-containing protein [Caenorhabditis elegans]|uniref:T20D4.11-like domain-containing protein n=1 Tax=Caenorhabditis elegans TaxID=6239 RepID=Q9XWY1_CAEEL|nr:DUF19 domain-containing protein [Caenorhabditis elegans]CAA21505.1 DUF19 domain-containing protein [Caenorhabditis elegans]|eukprot:NP_507788.1 Uncharacterized protein CELE_Y43F8B.11 [Caenorhabditis elegans]
MKSSLFFLFSWILVQISSATTCTTTDQIKFLQCKGSMIKIQDLLKLYAPYTETPVPGSVFKQISKLCDVAVKCVDQITCAEARKGVSMMEFACEGIEMSSGPFGDCLAKVQQNPPDSEKYPCAELFVKNSLDTISKGCQLFTHNSECVVTVAKDLCGAQAADSYKKGAPYMKKLMNCS